MTRKATKAIDANRFRMEGSHQHKRGVTNMIRQVGGKFRSLLTVSTVAVAATFAFAGAVNAADMIEPEPEMVSDWTGFYLGAHFGVAGGDFEYPVSICDTEDTSDCIDADFELDSSGLFAGGQICFNWQMNNLVLGIEADASWTNLEGKLDADINFFDDADFNLSAGSEVNWFGTIRGRLGFLLTPAFLVYGTGGAAFGDVESGYNVSLCQAGNPNNC